MGGYSVRFKKCPSFNESGLSCRAHGSPAPEGRAPGTAAGARADRGQQERNAVRTGVAAPPVRAARGDRKTDPAAGGGPTTGDGAACLSVRAWPVRSDHRPPVSPALPHPRPRPGAGRGSSPHATCHRRGVVAIGCVTSALGFFECLPNTLFAPAANGLDSGCVTVGFRKPAHES